jgi:hypothetical protein
METTSDNDYRRNLKEGRNVCSPHAALQKRSQLLQEEVKCGAGTK